MAEGIRIVHSDPELRGKTVVIPTFRRYPLPRMCTLCKRAHETKHYHLRLDGEGAIVVSATVLARLREIGMAGFTVESTVADPPAQRIGGRPDKRQLAYMARALEGIAPPGTTVRVTGDRNGG